MTFTGRLVQVVEVNTKRQRRQVVGSLPDQLSNSWPAELVAVRTIASNLLEALHGESSL